MEKNRGYFMHGHRAHVVITMIIFVVAALAVICSPAGAEKVYKWIDDDGVIHLSDSPPRKSESAKNSVEVIRVPMSRNRGASDSVSDEGGITIPLTATNQGYLVDVLFNDSVKATLVLDTGASLVVISENLFRRLGQKKLRGAPKVKLITANGLIEADPSIIRKIQVGTVFKENVPTAVTPDSVMYENCDGLLGLSFLRDFHMTIDHEKKTIVLKER
ncbi:MAG: TIGR02281 family clan AA aspartic protease [Deltaproteobacteria bacterium]|nr:TIGR02281 family clan AA aspartic protease [Deltaproteobacteria bacterium]